MGANFSVGYDHVDIEAAKARGLIVTNTPDVLSDATAELTMMLMLGAARRASEGERLVRTREWKDWSPSFMVGTQVTGKRLGIIGLGRVGRVVAKRARGFDMEVHYHNRRRVPPELEEGAVYHPTPEGLMPHCDFLTLHCVAIPETAGLLNAKRIALLLLILPLILLAACAPAAPTNTGSLKLALLPIIDTLPIYVAEAEGLFDKHGVTVELIPVASAPERDQLLAAGQADGTINEMTLIQPNGTFKTTKK